MPINSLNFPSSFRVKLKMLSDWHVGSGAGRSGSVDRLIIRDADDLPFVPAKTLTGIWRDALERLAYALDDGLERTTTRAPGKLYWADWVDVLFGSQPALTKPDDDHTQTEKPRPASVSLSPARLPEALRERLRDRSLKHAQKPLRDALTFIKPSVAIEKESGVAAPQFLRFEEMGRMEMVLEATGAIQTFSDEQQTVAAALLMTSSRLVERVGGKRRRGAGKCEMIIESHNETLPSLDDVLQWLQEHGEPPAPPAIYEEQTPEVAVKNVDKGEGMDWVSVKLRLELRTPVAIVTRTLGNAAKTLDFVPGTYLLPYLTEKLLARYPAWRTAVAAGDIQALPATIEIDKERGVPVPRVLARHKVGGGFEIEKSVYNFLREAEDAKSAQQTRNYDEGYVGSLSKSDENKLPTYNTVPTIMMMHNTVEDEKQRPTEKVGGIYSREAIAPGVVLRSELRLRKEIAHEIESGESEDWNALLHGNCRLGVSRKDDYGEAIVSVAGIQEQRTSQSKTGAIVTEFTLYLISDTLLRDSRLNPSTNSKDLIAELKKHLPGVELKRIAGDLHARRIESWHEGWGKPRPSLVAIAAGSCVVLEVTSGVVRDDALKRIELKGIGERRGEGYGQLIFNPPLLLEKINGWAASEKLQEKPDSYNKAPLQRSDEDFAFARRIEMEAWRAALRRAVMGFAADHERRNKTLQWNSAEKKPPMSQLGGLSAVLQRLRREDGEDKGMQVVRDWLEHLEATANRRDKWPDGAIKKVKEFVAYEGNGSDQNKIWDVLRGHLEVPPAITENAEAEVKAELWAEAVRSYFDACIRAHKRKIEESNNEAESEGRNDGAEN